MTNRNLPPLSETLLQRVNRVIGRVKYQDWRFVAEALGGQAGNIVGLQVQFRRPAAYTGEMQWGQSRWEYFLPCASEDGIIKTAWLLVELTTRHEAMEAFKVDGQRLFDPHTPVSDLISMQQARQWMSQQEDVRD